jgi:3,4-dihydroxy 2-butanone 4-phosphate synthase/GTP cyclohydrolase II
MSQLTSVGEAIDEIRKGRLVIVVDAEDRENEGDLIGAAKQISTETVNFMLTYGRGLLCAPATAHRLELLELPPMVVDNRSLHGTAFTISVDAAHGTTTGISAKERALTLRALASSATRPEDLLRPGHVFPLRADPAGVLARPGHTEAVVELVNMAELGEVGVLTEVLNADGSMARLPDLEVLASRFGLKILTIEAVADELR